MNTYPEMCIYKIGEIRIQTTVYRDEKGTYRCHYTDGLTPYQYMQKQADPNRFICAPFDLVCDWIKNKEDDVYINKWVEISEDDYMDALECLPPQKWQTVDGVNFFQMSEHTTGNITAHYAVHKGKYYTAHRRTSAKYEDLAKEIKGES